MDQPNIAPPAVPPKRTSKDVWSEIEDFLATTDGISTRDAFRLGALVREYGSTASGECVAPVMEAIFSSLTKPKPPTTPKAPWEE